MGKNVYLLYYLTFVCIMFFFIQRAFFLYLSYEPHCPCFRYETRTQPSERKLLVKLVGQSRSYVFASPCMEVAVFSLFSFHRYKFLFVFLHSFLNKINRISVCLQSMISNPQTNIILLYSKASYRHWEVSTFTVPR